MTFMVSKSCTPDRVYLETTLILQRHFYTEQIDASHFIVIKCEGLGRRESFCSTGSTVTTLGAWRERFVTYLYVWCGCSYRSLRKISKRYVGNDVNGEGTKLGFILRCYPKVLYTFPTTPTPSQVLGSPKKPFH